MSARATSARAACWPSAADRSRVTLRLPTLSCPKKRLDPDLRGRSLRMWSPSGDSTLITLAPRSAIIRVQYGPAIMVVKSSTVRPSSGPGAGAGGVPGGCSGMPASGARLSGQLRPHGRDDLGGEQFQVPAGIGAGAGAGEDHPGGAGPDVVQHPAGAVVHVTDGEVLAGHGGEVLPVGLGQDLHRVAGGHRRVLMHAGPQVDAALNGRLAVPLCRDR